ncbi:MAG: hypothetical protein ACRD2L_01105 [Terriglobia bacterium]
MPFKRTTIYLEERDRRKIKTIQARYGLVTLSDTIRLAIHALESLSAEQEKTVEQFSSTGQKRRRGIFSLETPAAETKRNREDVRGALARIEESLREAKAKAQ